MLQMGLVHQAAFGDSGRFQVEIMQEIALHKRPPRLSGQLQSNPEALHNTALGKQENSA